MCFLGKGRFGANGGSTGVVCVMNVLCERVFVGMCVLSLGERGSFGTGEVCEMRMYVKVYVYLYTPIHAYMNFIHTTKRF